VADSIGGKAGAALHVGATSAFMNGMHLSVTISAVLCVISAWLVARYLPSVLSHEGAMRGPVEAMQDVATLGIGGVPPIFADESFPGDDLPEGVPTGSVSPRRDASVRRTV
jgi:DHA2 family multidrug resistance protein-like MFS transporter